MEEKGDKGDVRNQIDYAVVCVNEFANKFNLTKKQAFNYMYNFKGIEFIKLNYDIEHTLSLEDIAVVCRNNGGIFYDFISWIERGNRSN